MNLKRRISYGGTYVELWDSHYKLSVQYSGQSSITMIFRDGSWRPENGYYPDISLAPDFFNQAASAAVFAEEFVASGLTKAWNSEESLACCPGPIFVAESLRILLDDCGLQLETVYPYLVNGWKNELSEDQQADLIILQPRTAKLYWLFRDRLSSIPAVLHDIRQLKYRNPIGSVETGTQCSVFLENPSADIYHSELELYGDDFHQIIPMERDQNIWEAFFQAPLQPAALWYRFNLKTYKGDFRLYAGDDGVHGAIMTGDTDSGTGDEGSGFRFTVYETGFNTPEWYQNAVMYQIFPDRFGFSNDGTAEQGIAYHKRIGQNPELHLSLEEEVRWKSRDNENDYIPDDFYGGTINGIIQKLPELQKLGVTCLYLNPIFEARSNHRYDTSDYLHIDPVLGTNDDFARLCQCARSFGIRILCDGVFSHTGADSLYFNRDGHYPQPGACQNEVSDFDAWYDFQHFPDQYRCWWGFRELPEVQELNPGWQNYIINGEQSVIRRWLRLGASGWRLDVADELPDEVLQMIRRAVKEEDRENVVLGEVWEDAVLKISYGHRRRYALGSALDSVMNYPFRRAVLDFLHQKSSAFELSDFLSSQFLHYPPPFYRALMNLLGSHDVERIRTSLATDIILKDLPREKQLEIEASIPIEEWKKAGELTRLAFLIAFSIPGVPSIYYGDELGMTGVNDPFNRRPYGSHSNEDLRDYLSELSQRRKDHPAISSGEVFFLAGGKDVLLILSRDQKESILTAVNRASACSHYSVSCGGVHYSGSVAPQSGETVIIPDNNELL